MVEYIKKKDTGCKLKIHASTVLKMNGFFMIKKIKNSHTYGIACNDIRNCRFTSKLIKKLIRDEVWDNPSVKPKYIIERFRRDYGRSLSYYYAYIGKELALKEIYSDDSLSYSFNILHWEIKGEQPK